jgi:hypothetical protein
MTDAAFKAGYDRIDWKPLPAPEREPEAPVARSGLACPMTITDTMPPTQHVDGKTYTSKSAFRAVTKARGYVEVGNDPARHKRPEKVKPDRAAIKQAVAQAAARHGL